MSLNVKPTRVTGLDRPLVPVALSTALVLVTYVTPMATLPATAASLDAGVASRAWILSSMSVGLAAALLASGVLGDAWGRRRLFVSGLLLLGAGSLVCAVATTSTVLVGGRVVQGMGGAAVLACGLAALAHRFAPGPERVHATSVWGASVGLGIAVGSLLPAVIEPVSPWRATYALTGLLALLLVPLALTRMAESSSATPRRIDLPGLVLLVVGLTLLVAALTQGRSGLDVLTVVLAVLGLAALGGLALVERVVDEPLVDPLLLGKPRFVAASLGSLVLGGGMIGTAAFVPTVVQSGLGSTLWVASILTCAWALTSVTTSMLVRRIPHPLEGPRPIAALLVVVALGLLTGAGLSADSTPWRLVVPMVVAGLATGVLNAVLGREAVASVPPDRAAMGSGANNTARYLGAACGITLFVSVATHAGSGVGAAALVAGWNIAVLVAAALTLVGAAVIATVGLRTRV